jgi:hypothetical protein
MDSELGRLRQSVPVPTCPVTAVGIYHLSFQGPLYSGRTMPVVPGSGLTVVTLAKAEKDGAHGTDSRRPWCQDR